MVQDTQHILYTFIRCPWAMRARIALALAGIEYEHREVDLKNKPRHLLEISPKGTVPVLITKDGEVIDESLEIIYWALDKNTPVGTDEIIAVNDDDFKFNINRYKYPDRYPEDTNSRLYYRDKCCEFLEFLEKKLEKHQYILADKIGVVDVAIFPLIRQFSKVEPDWFAKAPYPKVQKWIETISDSDYFAAAMVQLPNNL